MSNYICKQSFVNTGAKPRADLALAEVKPRLMRTGHLESWRPSKVWVGVGLPVLGLWSVWLELTPSRSVCNFTPIICPTYDVRVSPGDEGDC